MKKTLSILFVLILSISSFGQNPNDALISYSGGMANIKNIKQKKHKTKGSYYYTENWNTGTIKLFSGETIENYPLKYDMKMNQIDIKVGEEIKAISIGAVKEIIWVKSNGATEVLRNSIIYDKNSSGLFLIINDGKTPLLKKTHLELQEANYNPALDVGSRAKKWIKTEVYYTVIDGKIKKIKNNKRKIKKIFKDKSQLVEEYANENKLSYRRDNDLAKIFNYYNSL